MSSSELLELQAQIAELEASLRDAPPEQAALLRQSLDSARQAAAMLGRVQPALAEAAAHRPAVPPEVLAFFRPEPPAPVPAWLPDTLTRSEVHEAMLRCPPGARVYTFESSLSCAFPGVAGQTLNVPHGLSVGFASTGRLSYQRFYEHGLCRWAIDYHPTGGRSQVGFYADREAKQFLPHGLQTQFSIHGAVRVQSHYWNGLQHGWTKQWEDDGYPLVATLYDNGRAVEQVRPDGSRQRL